MMALSNLLQGCSNKSYLNYSLIKVVHDIRSKKQSFNKQMFMSRLYLPCWNNEPATSLIISTRLLQNIDKANFEHNMYTKVANSPNKEELD